MQSICNHDLHHVHTLIAVGILLHVYLCFFNCFLYFFSMKTSMKNLLLKRNTEDLLRLTIVKENTDKEV